VTLPGSPGRLAARERRRADVRRFAEALEPLCCAPPENAKETARDIAAALEEESQIQDSA
jgi:hypothetical protein